MARKIEELESQIEDLKEEIKNLSQAEADEMIDKVRDTFDDIKAKSKMAWHKTKEKGEKIKEYAEDNPWQAVGIAAAVGFVLGLMIGKKKD